MHICLTSLCSCSPGPTLVSLYEPSAMTGMNGGNEQSKYTAHIFFQIVFLKGDIHQDLHLSFSLTELNAQHVCRNLTPTTLQNTAVG